MFDNIKVLLVGAGPMAVDYASILKDINVDFDVIGRGSASAQLFSGKTGVTPSVGGLDLFAIENDTSSYSHAIIATGVENLAENAILTCTLGIKKILVEKPGGLNLEEIERLKDAALKSGAEVFIAYNRRFYSSVGKAREIIQQDGGITSFNFDFTEWSHKIEPLVKADGVKKAWLLANSTHVIDLAFHLGGNPTEFCSFASGNLPWHKNSIYAGAGITDTGSLFSYSANWESAGRWGVELMTKKRKIVLRPIEQIYIQERGSIDTNKITIDDTVDTNYKPGLYRQTLSFLKDDVFLLPSIQDQYVKVKEVYLKIMNQ